MSALHQINHSGVTLAHARRKRASLAGIIKRARWKEQSCISTPFTFGMTATHQDKDEAPNDTPELTGQASGGAMHKIVSFDPSVHVSEPRHHSKSLKQHAMHKHKSDTGADFIKGTLS